MSSKILFSFLLIITFYCSAMSQVDSAAIDKNSLNYIKYSNKDSVYEHNRQLFDSLNNAKKDSIQKKADPNSSPSVLPVTYAIGAFLYLFNPIVLLENDKIAAGITKEISVGFGDFGQNRISFEYSFLFRESAKSHYRFSIKHDFLLKEGILPSNMLQTTPVLSVGGGYFTDLNYGGVFPEISYGFSIRNNKLLIFPHIKTRYTFIFGTNSEKSDIIDISLGLMLGIANPFIDNHIRRKY
ncbi:hypothetical protein BH10BAC5_BH10BAC5_08280 [soil metagenome]